MENGEDIQEFKPEAEQLQVSWSTTETPPHSDSYYYVRITLAGGKDLAWSSPVWVTD